MVMNNIYDMSLQELKQLKRKRYEEASKNGTLDKIAEVARALGKRGNENYMRNLILHDEVIHVYLDDNGQYMTVKWQGKQVCSTHRTDPFYIPGPWVDAILAYHGKASVEVDTKSIDAEHRERERLLVRAIDRTSLSAQPVIL